MFLVGSIARQRAEALRHHGHRRQTRELSIRTAWAARPGSRWPFFPGGCVRCAGARV